MFGTLAQRRRRLKDDPRLLPGRRGVSVGPPSAKHGVGDKFLAISGPFHLSPVLAGDGSSGGRLFREQVDQSVDLLGDRRDGSQHQGKLLPDESKHPVLRGLLTRNLWVIQ